jgi:hypothetical protein
MRKLFAIAALAVLLAGAAIAPAAANCFVNPYGDVTQVVFNNGDGTCYTRNYIWYCGHIVWAWNSVSYSC